MSCNAALQSRYIGLPAVDGLTLQMVYNRLLRWGLCGLGAHAADTFGVRCGRLAIQAVAIKHTL